MAYGLTSRVSQQLWGVLGVVVGVCGADGMIVRTGPLTPASAQVFYLLPLSEQPPPPPSCPTTITTTTLFCRLQRVRSLGRRR